jgi:hypothetical protein
MKATNTKLKIVFIATALAALQGCASAPIEPEAVPEAVASSSQSGSGEVIHRVRPHERLGDIAIKYTGNATNWENIARYNGISNPTRLRVGTMIAIPNSLAVKRSARQKTNDVVLEPVKTNRAFQLSPIKESELVRRAQKKAAAVKVQVVGTYYPKGIYRQPANYSTLVMRAAPGTLFDVEYLANDWYKIVTKNGIGYLREDDGKVVAASAQP